MPDAAPHNYPSFWDAIPVDPPQAPRPAPRDAYTQFVNATEAVSAVLSVDRLEVD